MKILSSIFLLLFLFLGLNSRSSAQTANLNKDELKLLRTALETALITRKTLPDHNSLPYKKEVWLLDKMISMENTDIPPVYLGPKQIPKFKDLKIKLTTEAELKDTARQEDILFVRLGQFRIPQEKEQPAIIHIMAQWALGKEGRSKGYVHKQASGCAMGFKRTKNGWEYLNTFYTFINEKQL